MGRKFSSMDMCAHVWAQQSQDEGSANSGRLFFSKKTIYSYGSHFPIATFIDNGKERRILFNATRYSHSTSNHQNIVWGAVRHLQSLRLESTETIKYITNISETKSTFFKKGLVAHVESYLDGVILRQAQSVAKRRKASLKESDISVARNAFEACESLLSFFGAKMPVRIAAKLETLSADSAAIIAANEKEIQIARRKAELKAKKERARREKIALEAASLWIKGEQVSYELMSALRISNVIYLRVSSSGENIETSWGAEFPVKFAAKAWAVVRGCKIDRKEWEKNGRRIPLGHFEIDRIEADGKVIAGCHVVHFSEIERIAKQLGLA